MEGFGYDIRAQFYDVEYVDRADQDFLIASIGPGTGHVLVVPGATGETALAIKRARPEVAVTSLDIEREMHAIARAKFASHGGHGLHSVQGDMTDLSLDQRFDRIFVVREALQMFLGDGPVIACLRTLGAHLSAAGRLVVDLANYEVPPARSDIDYFRTDRMSGAEHLMWTRPFAGQNLSKFVTQRLDAGGVITLAFRYVFEPATGSDAPIEDQGEMSFRHHHPGGFEALVAAAGLRVAARYGDYDESKLEPSAPRQIYILAGR